jgi:hypothetical protein
MEVQSDDDRTTAPGKHQTQTIFKTKLKQLMQTKHDTRHSVAWISTSDTFEFDHVSGDAAILYLEIRLTSEKCDPTS